MQVKQRITPFLTYVNQAAEAASFYTRVFPDGRILGKVSNPADQSVLTVEFQIAGMKFVGLNAGEPARNWKFTEALSMSVSCETQAELDSLWSQLTSDGGREVACGWLQDKFGMFWQIVPAQLNEWLDSGEPEKIHRMFTALWQMTKLEIATLQRAFDGNES
jgi:predicted 3-demethylubiquinone-9 3-methyltransferase (glyoxalase superfamily)